MSILNINGLDVKAAIVKSELVAEILPLDVDAPVLKSIVGVLLLYTVKFAVGLVVPIPTLPLSNIDPVATVEADANLTT